MKKWASLLLLAITSYCSVHAQVRLGILGGLHSSKVLETNHIPGWDTTTKPFNSTRSGFQLGLILEMPIGHHGLFFQPAFTYITKGRTYDKNNDSVKSLLTDTIYNKQTLKLSYMEIPLNFTYKLPLTANRMNSFFISAGPYVSFVYSGNVTTESLTATTKKYSTETDPVTVGKGPDTYSTLDYGVNARAGFEIGNVMLSAYYSRGLGNFYHASYSGTFHHELVGATLGIWLTSSGPAKALRKKDTDRDGVNDDVDLCPLQPGPAAWHGCPVPDTDHDGVDDDHDSCRTIPGVGRYNGCPVPDTDHDGIDDEHDSCRTVPGLARYNGCPIPDRDHDGINDEEDKCPDSAGTAENHGCPVVVVPEIKKEETEQINFIAHNVNFASASDRLLDSSYVALDQLAGLLLAHPAWHLTIEGYTDNSGTPAKNLLLSRKRADAVKVYLVHKGIPATRLTPAGFGQEKPIADNRTARGKAANRRVELKLSIMPE
ncbi:MAG TPA: OmpA family protein [Puia sp.]|nr:OmpA family protein [Puia sp.]